MDTLDSAPSTATDTTLETAGLAKAGGDYNGVTVALWLVPMIVAAFLALFAVGAALFASHGLKSLYCAATVGDTQTSADGRYTAQAYRLHCVVGGEPTNVQVVDHHHAWLPLAFRRDDAFCTVGCLPGARSRAPLSSIKLTWSDARTLVVTGTDRDRIFGHQTVDVPWSETYRMQNYFWGLSVWRDYYADDATTP
jgi:hypothetical protein